MLKAAVCVIGNSSQVLTEKGGQDSGRARRLACCLESTLGRAEHETHVCSAGRKASIPGLPREPYEAAIARVHWGLPRAFLPSRGPGAPRRQFIGNFSGSGQRTSTLCPLNAHEGAQRRRVGGGGAAGLGALEAARFRGSKR
jgi:hypothetical protein